MKNHQSELKNISNSITVLQHKLNLLRSELYRTKTEVHYERVVNQIEGMELEIDELQRVYEKKRIIAREGSEL